MRGLGLSGVAIGAAGTAMTTALLLAGCSTTGAGGPAPPAHARATQLCQNVTFPIYFAEWSDQLTPNAQRVLATVAAQLHGCRIGYVSVLGLTDAKGTPVDNLELSKRRANVVASALQNAGLPAPRFEVRGIGEVGAIGPDGKPVPLHRKTEVAIEASPPG